MTPRPNFLELPVADAERASRFYSQAFGWALTGFGPTYACTMTGDVDLGLQADPAEQSRTPLIVIQADDLAAAVAQVEAAGGTITRPIFAFPGGERFHFTDPDGNELAVHKPG